MIKDMATVAVGWILGIAIVLSSLFVLTAQEDDWWFNCHLSGNMVCGSEAPWHGFVHVSTDDTPKPVYRHTTTAETFEYWGPVEGLNDRAWLVSTTSKQSIQVDWVDLYYHFETVNNR